MGYPEYIILYFCALMIGITKAGFGGGTGLIITPLLASIMPAKEAVGMMLPLLLATDIFAMFHYFGKWDKRNVLQLLPGALVGILVGTFVLNFLVGSDVYFKRTIGVIAFTFFIVQILRSRLVSAETGVQFKHWHGIAVGAATGFVSTLAHIGGVITSMFLLPQKLSNQAYVGTTTATYFLVNAAKIAPYIFLKLFTRSNLFYDAILIPVIPLGVLLGIFLNKRVSSAVFSKIILAIVFVTSLKLLGVFTFLWHICQWIIST